MDRDSWLEEIKKVILLVYVIILEMVFLIFLENIPSISSTRDLKGGKFETIIYDYLYWREKF